MTFARTCIKLLQAVALLGILVGKCQSFQQTHAPGLTTRLPSNRIINHNNAISTPRNQKFQRPSSTSTRLEAANLLAAAGSPAGAFLVLTGIIVVHEAGHYLAARSYGIKVEEFAIGFGPKLFGFSALGNEFNFRAFPLGGYVRFPENYNITLAQETERQLREDMKQYRKEMGELAEDRPKTPGYQLVNFLTLGAMDKNRKEEDAKTEALSQQQKEEPKQPWWKSILASNQAAKEVKVPVKPMDPEDIEIEYYDDPDLLQNRPWFERAVVLSGGVAFNLLLAFTIFFGEISTTGLPQPVFDQGIVITQNPGRDSAANGILRKGDVVVGVNGNSLTLAKSPSAVSAQEAISDFISVIRTTPDGDSLFVSVLRDRNSNPVDVTIQPKRADANGPKTIGVMLSPNYVKTEIIKANNPAEAVVPAAKLVSTMTQDTAAGLTKVFGQFILGKDRGGQQVSGPIGLIKTGADIVSSNNWSTVLAFAAAVSINLGVVNAFPLPALDGGQLVFVAVEALTKKKVSQRLQEEVTGITVLLLIFVSASAALGDVQNLLLK